MGFFMTFKGRRFLSKEDCFPYQSGLCGIFGGVFDSVFASRYDVSRN